MPTYGEVTQLQAAIGAFVQRRFDRDWDDAQDVAARAIEIAVAHAQLDEHAPVSLAVRKFAWGVAKRLAGTDRRTEARRRDIVDAEAHVTCPGEQEVLARLDACTALSRVAAVLSPRERAVFRRMADDEVKAVTASEHTIASRARRRLEPLRARYGRAA